MDESKRKSLIERIKAQHGDSNIGPSPLVNLEEFFEGNDDWGSIGCNLSPVLGPSFFYEHLKTIRSLPDVRSVMVEIDRDNGDDPSSWPFADTVYVFAQAELQDVEDWMVPLGPDEVIEEDCHPPSESGVRTFVVWWD